MSTQSPDRRLAPHSCGQTLGAAHADVFPRGPRPEEYDALLLRIWMEGIPVWIPNPPAHGAALRLHDLHHVLTGYGTDWVGEAELGAFELASGCGRHVGAFPFDLAALGMGLAIAPARTFRAFVRGRRSANLFGRGFDRNVLDRPLDELREELRLTREGTDTRSADRALFAWWSVLGVAFYLAAPITIPLSMLLQLAPAPRSRSQIDR